jgi:hypothetical protein
VECVADTMYLLPQHCLCRQLRIRRAAATSLSQVRWLPRNTLKIHPPGTERRWLLRPITIRRPSWQSGRRVRWFGNGTGSSADALAIRIPLINPADGRATIGGYTCPCNPKVEGDPASPGMCPACDEARQKAGDNPCKDNPCCTDPKCADGGLT